MKVDKCALTIPTSGASGIPHMTTHAEDMPIGFHRIALTILRAGVGDRRGREMRLVDDGLVRFTGILAHRRSLLFPAEGLARVATR